MSQSETILGLGGRADYVATVPGADPARLRLTPEERAVLACVGRAARIQEVLERSGMAEPRTIAALLSLRAKGAIAPAKVAQASSPTLVSAAQDEQVDLDPARKREILELERVLDTANHFEVLGVAPGASAEEVKKAFFEASRRFHPDRYFGKSLGSFRARIERIFRRVSEAHQVLADAQRRAAYLMENPTLAAAARLAERAPPPPAAPRSPEDERREEERRQRFARHPYLAQAGRTHELLGRARQQLSRGDFGRAFTELNTAAQLDPKNAEVKALLAETRRQHDAARAAEAITRAEQAETAGDLEAAVEHYRAAAGFDAQNVRAAYRAARLMLRLGRDPREAKPLAQRAVELEPKSADHHALLAQLLEGAGMKALSKRHFDEALRLDPQHPEAKKHAKRRWPF